MFFLLKPWSVPDFHSLLGVGANARPDPCLPNVKLFGFCHFWAVDRNRWRKSRGPRRELRQADKIEIEQIKHRFPAAKDADVEQRRANQQASPENPGIERGSDKQRPPAGAQEQTSNDKVNRPRDALPEQLLRFRHRNRQGVFLPENFIAGGNSGKPACTATLYARLFDRSAAMALPAVVRLGGHYLEGIRASYL